MDSPPRPPSALPEPPQTAVPPHPQQQPPSSQQQGLPPPPAPDIKREWPASALTPTPAPPPVASTDVKPGSPAPPASEDPAGASPSGGSYRPLNVKDALSYLEMVKVKFNDRPDVYNQFLDIMKDFKSQAIDTPGVIGRVSLLFTGHPQLIQGFNTFLPQGYRIECSEEDNQNTITVTTPTGTHTQTSDGAFVQRAGRLPVPIPGSTPVATPGVGANGMSAYFPTNGALTPNGVPPVPQPFNDPVPPPGGPGSPLPPPPIAPQQHLSPHPHPPPPIIHSPRPHSTPHHSNAPSPMPSQQQQQQQGGDNKRPVEFNHAINYVNKIKNRFSSDPDTYKQFLEILQTYQKEQRPISSVYEQVAVLFNGSVDLLDEFKQFLPENSGNGGGMNGGMMADGMMAAINAPSAMPSSSSSSKPSGGGGKDKGGRQNAAPPPPPPQAVKETSGQRKSKKRAAEKDPIPPPAPPPQQQQQPPPRHHMAPPSHHQQPGPPQPGPPKAKKAKHSHTHAHAAASPPPLPPPAVAAPVTDEAAFFDRVKKYIDDRTTYNEFLKLLHLFTEEIVDMRTLVDRAAAFLGGETSELTVAFKDVVGWDERVVVDGELGQQSQTLGGGRGTVAVVPTMERPKVDLNTCKKFGPSYRKLPKHEAELACSGRDAMCWEVLNDEWVSHPTWASEDAGFSTHKKNMYEDAMHKSEEERHEYDFHIEALTRTINVLEPLHNRIQVMEPDERAAFKLKPGLGGQGKSVYQRIIKKIYGREHGVEIVNALHESPVVTIPVILARLKQKEEEWKRAQREWNKVWREVDARNFYKSLDHQGINFKVNDKKSVNPKQLVQDIETRKRELDAERLKVHPLPVQRWHFAYEVRDVAVLQDCVKLVLSFLDRAPGNSAMAQDANQIEMFLKSFVPMFFMLDEEEFCAPFTPPEERERERGERAAGGEDGMMDVDSVVAPPSSSGGGRKKKGGNGGGGGGGAGGAGPENLRKKALLKGGGGANGSTSGSHKKGATAAGRKSASSSRFASPALTDSVPMQVAEDGGAATPLSSSSSRVQDNVWIRHGRLDHDDVGPSSGRKVPRKGTFFANNTFYVLLRNLQLLYSRLHAAKKHSIELAAAAAAANATPSAGSSPPPPPMVIEGQIEHRPLPHAYLANPLAVSLGLADATGPGASRLIPAGPNPAGQFYEHTLECCEQLFDNEMDQATFEDHLRFMFGIRAYHLFTVDKVVGSVIKQVQAVLSDVKNKELLTLLRRERSGAVGPTVQEQINARRTAEHMIGPDENMYRILWLPSEKVMQIQLLAKDDASTDDAVNMTERWKQYMASYVLRHQTEGLASPVSAPLLQRTLFQIKPEQPEDANDGDDEGKDKEKENDKDKDKEDVPAAGEKKPRQRRPTPDMASLGSTNFRYGSKSGVEIKVCIRTYRIFFETGGEDLFYRKHTSDEDAARLKRAEEREGERKDRFKKWLDGKVAPVEAKEVEMKDEQDEGAAAKDAVAAKDDGDAPEKEKEKAAEEDVEMMAAS